MKSCKDKLSTRQHPFMRENIHTIDGSGIVSFRTHAKVAYHIERKVKDGLIFRFEIFNPVLTE